MGRRHKRNSVLRDEPVKQDCKKQGFIGTLRKAAKSFGRRIISKKGNTEAQGERHVSQDEVNVPASQKMAPLNNQMFEDLRMKSSASIENLNKLSELQVEELTSRCERLADELELAQECLDETRELFDGLHVDLKKVREKLYCMDSMQETRYEFLKSYLPEAKEQLWAEQERHTHTRQVLADRLNCEPEDLWSILQQGPRATTQTHIVPDNILEQLTFYDQQACESHITMMTGYINDHSEEMVTRNNQLQEIKNKQQLELEARMKMRKQLQFRLNALERQRDFAKRMNMGNCYIPETHHEDTWN